MNTNIKNNKKTKNATYKNMLSIIERNGAQYIEMNLSDMIPFIKYINNVKYKPRVYIKIINNRVRFSKQPLSKTKIDIKSEIEYQKIINQ